MQLLKNKPAQAASELGQDRVEQCANDRHVLVNSNQQARGELKGQLCALRNRGKLSEMKKELLISVCFRFEPNAH